MRVPKKSMRVLLCCCMGAFIFSTQANAQFQSINTAMSSDGYTSWLNESVSSGGVWGGIFKSDIAYANNHPSEEIVQITAGLMDGSFRNWEKNVYAFTGDQPQTITTSSWDTTGLAWVESGTTTLTWAGDLLTNIDIDGLLMGMDATIAVTFTYNNDGKPIYDSSTIILTVEGLPEPVEMKNTSAITYAEGYELTISSELDDASGEYLVTDKDSSVLCSDGKDSLVYNSEFSDPDWTPVGLDVFTYTAGRAISSVLTKGWDATASEWADESRTTYGYVGSAIDRKIASIVQTAKQKATQKMLAINSNPQRSNPNGVAYDILGRRSNNPVVSHTAPGLVIMRNTVQTQR